MQSRNLCVSGDDKKKLPCNPSPATDTVGVCDEALSHEEGFNSPQINMFSDVPPSGVPPHTGEICLLGSTGEAEDIPLEAHQALIAEISSEKGDVSLKKYYVVPLLQYFGYKPEKSLEEGSSRRLSHEQKTEYIGGCHVLYDPIVGYMEGLGKDDDWSHL